MRTIAFAAAVLLPACVSGGATSVPAAAPRVEAPATRVATLQHDPREVLATVARHMGIRLRPIVPLPVIRFESRTPLARLQQVAERQWGIRPREFMNVYVAEENAIYLIDDAARLARSGGALDDALAHEFVHYLQANYRKDGFARDWAEVEALRVQTWFRQTYMATRLARNNR